MFRKWMFLLLLCAAVSSCGRKNSAVHQYREVSRKPVASSPTPNQFVEGELPELAMQAPEGWIPAASQPPRLATFDVVGPDGSSAQCTVVAFDGEVGSLRQNLDRWAGQLGLTPSAELLDRVEQQAEKVLSAGSLEITIVDFTREISNPSANMLAALFSRDGFSVFVKLMGTEALVVQERENFRSFCGSIH